MRSRLESAIRVDRRFASAILTAIVSFAGAAPLLAQHKSVTCAACHAEQAGQLELSIHRSAVRCQECHGGKSIYELTHEQLELFGVSPAAPIDSKTARSPFDHGKTFLGKARRADIPQLCGTCHADVEKMNPYGLRTDQLSSYWVSGHGKQLKQTGDDRVAVCIDCHGSHDVLKHDNTDSRTYFQNVAETCGRCHSDRALMTEHNLSPDVVEQYRHSVHGRNVLEFGDAGSPTCATCHGSHAAAPPGFAEVGHVCGRCHKQIEDYVLSGVHGRILPMARCTGCHGQGGDPKNHLIEEASPPTQELIRAYLAALEQEGGDVEKVRANFVERLDNMSGALRLATACGYCHAPEYRRTHMEFFEDSDRLARRKGRELETVLRDSQFEYARISERVDRVARGVLLVKDEAVRAEDAKTEVMALYSFIHTLNLTEVELRAQKTREICEGITASLDEKEAGLARRRMILLPMWGFIAVFSVAMYRKYRLLRAEYVRVPGQPAATAEALPSISRRRLLDAGLGLGGLVSALALLWPAVSYVLPARKRGGGSDQVSAGTEDGWQKWEVRMVVLAGKPVAVIRADDGFRAFSAVCTHLGCIVHWDSAKRQFSCPCHAATFDEAGQVVSGPPPTALPEYRVSAVQGEVIVMQRG